jgi:hypothetical protein
LGARVTFLDSYSRVEKSKAYAAEEKLRKDEYEAQRQAEDLANSQRDQQYRIAQEQFRQQKTAICSAAPGGSNTITKCATGALLSEPSQCVFGTASAPCSACSWETSSATHVAGLLGRPGMEIHALDRIFDHLPAIWRHHTEAATIYTDYTDAAITNALPAIGAVAALILRWLEMPGLVSGIALGTGIILAIAYAVFATFRTNQGALSITLVIVAKLTLITVFYALIGMLIASLFSNSARRKGESQACCC